jgi:hypothetical protein
MPPGNGMEAKIRHYDLHPSPGRQLPLFGETTRHQARLVAAQSSAGRYRQIMEVLTDGPACIFEVAARLGCFDHQISGRFGELERQGLIEKTGRRKAKPETGCAAEEYRLCPANAREPARDARDSSPSNN